TNTKYNQVDANNAGHMEDCDIIAVPYTVGPCRNRVLISAPFILILFCFVLNWLIGWLIQPIHGYMSDMSDRQGGAGRPVSGAVSQQNIVFIHKMNRDITIPSIGILFDVFDKIPAFTFIRRNRRRDWRPFSFQVRVTTVIVVPYQEPVFRSGNFLDGGGRQRRGNVAGLDRAPGL